MTRSSILGSLSIGLAAVSLAFLCCGAVWVSPTQVGGVIAAGLGIDVPATWNGSEAAIVWLRLPRLVVGMAAGAALASGGVALQALFRNPLVDPGLIGIAAGAALAAATVTVLGGRWSATTGTTPLNVVILQTAAFGGALAASAAVYRLGRRHGVVSTPAMLLAGIAITALAGALTGLLIFIADDAQLRSLTFWNLGSLGNSGPAHVSLALIVLPVLWWLSRSAQTLDVLLLGDASARLLGVDVGRFQRRIIVAVALSVGTAVAVIGVVGFVGLVVPHLLRLTVGASHRTLVPASALAGAGLLSIADTAARTAVAPAELPLGVVTALVGAPFFLWLLQHEWGRVTAR